MSVQLYVNVGTSDLARSESGSEYVLVDLTYDKIIITNGSDVVTDEAALPTEAQLNSAGTLLEGTLKNANKYYLYDYSAGKLREIYGMGNQDAQYVLCFAFDALTNTEPVLEAWDSSDLNTTDLEVLGEGTPANSWLRAICTTTSSSGSSWVGTIMAGSGAGRYIQLNDGNGALSGASDLYCNIKIVFPATAVSAFAVLPVIVVKYT